MIFVTKVPDGNAYRAGPSIRFLSTGSSAEIFTHMFLHTDGACM